MHKEGTTETITIPEAAGAATYHFLSTTGELAKRDGQLTRWLDGHDILLYEHEGAVKALSNICRHFGGPVGYLKAQDGVFTCQWHNWQYSCKDGSCITHPGSSLRSYAVKVIGDKIYVNLLG